LPNKDSGETISVVIPTKNEGELMAACLKSVYNQSTRPSEVIIVDGGSTDNTLEIATKYGAKIVKEQGFSSPANARNLGVELSEGTILLIMDADVILQQDCLKNALKAFNDETVIGVLPYEQNQDDSYIERIQRKWNEGSRTAIGIGLKQAKTSGLVGFYRKEVLERVKFDTRYGFGEDDDFSARIEMEFHGRKIFVAEDCKVISHSPHTFNEFATRYTWWGRTFAAYFAGHFGLKSILNLSSLLLPLIVVITLFASILFAPALLAFIVLLSLFIVKTSVICYRSKSYYLIQFMFFDLTRSFFFTAGLAQSMFSRGKGR
jgi:glycosyltransferase involved in cell wall biosynthesis